ncbi:type VII secretion-associated serine protease mycosin [Pseudonocardia sp.]|uniref:type VII secretion-associated serine protease mycosin n=1 Tax=Pseudonocardia sp. TaxID=60912 RepID=UPI002623ED77|nr:type VII secretion-associated serine protease mycosin [Pseudonocardia sp.]
MTARRPARTTAHAVLGVLVALGACVYAGAPTGGAGIAPAAGPRSAVATASGSDPPVPPPVRVAAPAGRAPGPAAGLRAPARCDPPPRGAEVPAGPSPADRLQLAAAHRIATGAGQLIAVIDTGVAPHPRLGSRLRGGGDYLTGGSGLDDCDGHGTAVAGLLAASRSADDEVVGIAPGADLLAIRQSSPSYTVPGPDGAPRPAGDLDTLAEAIVLAVRSGADVVNVSEAVCLAPERAAAQGAALHAALGYAAGADVVVVAAAGNAGVGLCAEDEDAAGQVSLPGWYDELVTVGATGPDDAPAPFSVPGPWVDVAGPGTAIRSLAVGGGVTADPVSGTSFSTPWVAGLAALVRERYPELTAAQVVDRILATARRPPGGRDDRLGHGALDPVAALTAEPAVLTPPGAVRTDPPTARLAGTTPVAPQPPPPPVDLVAVAGLLAAAACAAATVRRRPTGAGPRAS